MLSIIIPVYNEAKIIDAALSEISQQLYHNKDQIELIIVDGQSTDNTQEILKKHQDIHIITSKKGRATQMNTGAKAAKYDLLYFLHLDSKPPQYFDKIIIEASQNGISAGCFRLRFDVKHWWLKLIAWFTRFNFTVCRGGDQSLFVTQKIFESIKGFNEQYIVFEDHEIASRLYKATKFKVLPYYITTSARLFMQYGIFRLQYIFIKLYVKRYILKTSPEQLHHSFKNAIQKKWTTK